MSEKKTAHCPECCRPVLSNGYFLGTAQFNIRCPWCQSTVYIQIEPKVSVQRIRRQTNEPQEKNIETFVPTYPNDIHNDYDYNSMGNQDQGQNHNLYKIPPKGMKVDGYLYPDKRE